MKNKTKTIINLLNYILYLIALGLFFIVSVKLFLGVLLFVIYFKSDAIINK